MQEKYDPEFPEKHVAPRHGVRPHGRMMPHPHEAKSVDGSIDLNRVKGAMPDVVASFESGEYDLVDMNETKVISTQIASEIDRTFGVTVQADDEMFIAVRRHGHDRVSRGYSDLRRRRPQFRTMPHPHEAKNPDGTIDLAKAKAALPQIAESFESGEYHLVDMNEYSLFGPTRAKEISDFFGVDCREGDEVFVAVRRKLA